MPSSRSPLSASSSAHPVHPAPPEGAAGRAEPRPEAPRPSSLVKDPRGRRRGWERTCLVLGGLLIVGLYLWTVLTQPVEAAAGTTTLPAVVLYLGYFVAALLLLAGTLPQLPTGTLVLIPVALALNIVLGQFVGSALVPLYLDSIGTIIIAFLAGRAAGVATGVLGTLVWSLFNPTLLPFAAVAAVIGFCAGTAARWGVLRRLWTAPVFGFLTGVFSGMLSAPIAAFVFGGTTGAMTGAVVSAFTAYGDSILAATTKQSLISDPGDKAVCFLVAALLIRFLPQRTVRRVARKG